MDKKRILILGANGLLGTILVDYLKNNKLFQIVTHSQTSSADIVSDLSDLNTTDEMLNLAKADFCINLLALTDVDKSEADQKKAYQINVLPIKNIVKSKLTNSRNIKIIQISTDHVYNKENSTESDIKIVNYYALIKFLADEISQLTDSVVLRTNFFGKSQSVKQSFSDWIINNLSENKQMNGFTDVYFSPLHIKTLVVEIERVVLNYIPGVYNLGSNNGMSKYEFMVELSRHKNYLSPDIIPIKYSDSKLKIPRPLDMRMNVTKYENIYKTKLPNLSEEIKKC